MGLRAEPSPPVYLVTGSEELLVHRTSEALVGELRAALGGQVEFTDVRVGELPEGTLPDLRTASLFGDPRIVRIREAEALPAAAAAELAALLDAPAAGTTVVVAAKGTGRIRKLATAVKKAGGRIDVTVPADWDARGWRRLVADELARHDRRAGEDALGALLEVAGHDVTTIVSKVAEVVRVCPTDPLAATDVEAVLAGQGNRGAFAVADAMCARDPARAVALLRGALAAGEEPVMVLGALSYRIRSIVAAGGGLLDAGDAAEQRGRLGFSASAGQVKHLRRQRRAFGPGELTRAYATLAEADRALKGSDLPPGFVLEQAVAAIATAQPAP